jgi:hypothetical protein
MHRLRPFFYPALALALAFAAWQSFGWKGLLLAALMISFWMLLHFSKLMRVMRTAAHRPMGHVIDAGALQRRLRVGMPLVDVIRLTQSLGQLRSPPDQEPQHMTWGDELGHVVACTFVQGQLTAFELVAAGDRPEAVRAADAQGDGHPPAQP